MTFVDQSFSPFLMTILDRQLQDIQHLNEFYGLNVFLAISSNDEIITDKVLALWVFGGEC